MIIATAGHVDHGKTLLIRSLTGVDTDRLPEEKKRNLTIDLGFAYLPLEGEETIGFIDVPGHERFIRNMLCGVAGIDFVLFIVAADDGPMPQTEEHLAILDLLGVSNGAVALTKAFNPAVMTIAAVTAIVLAFVGKLGAFLQTIPGPVMGGILVLLFGGIVVVGMNTLVRAGLDLATPRNLVIVSVILVFGVGGMLFSFGEFRLEGIGLAGVVGVLLNWILPREREEAA